MICAYMAEKPELEKVFQRIEEESERRAQANEDSALENGTILALPPTTARPRKRRRGSISISRLGHVPESALAADGSSNVSVPSSPSPWSAFAVQSAQGQSRIENGSTESLSSEGSAFGSDEEDHHTTQKETVVQRQSIGKALGGLLSRRLSHMRSEAGLSGSGIGDNNVVIDVSVEATVEAREQQEADQEVVGGSASVTSTGTTLRHRQSTSSVKKWGSWSRKARGIAEKLSRRKS